MDTNPFKRRPEQPEDEGWLITFADMMTLLMCFFVLFFALSQPNMEQFKAMGDALKKKGFISGDNPVEDPYNQVKKELTLSLGQSGYDQFAAVSESKGGIDVELSAGSFFEAGNAKFSHEALPMLQLMSRHILPLAKKDIIITVEGYTDDTPVSTAQYPTNWELSSARAANVVRYFVAQGFPAEKLRVTGYGDTHPKAPNRDSAGNPIPANQDLNRRVVIRLTRGDDAL